MLFTFYIIYVIIFIVLTKKETIYVKEEDYL